MNVIISDEILQASGLTSSEFRQEMALYPSSEKLIAPKLKAKTTKNR